jgi:hypothetical protein
MALPFPLCKTTFIVGWVDARKPNNSYYSTANVGFHFVPCGKQATTQPTKIKLIFFSIRGTVEPFLFTNSLFPVPYFNDIKHYGVIL